MAESELFERGLNGDGRSSVVNTSMRTCGTATSS
jgi:hypothetical protein